ncbi:Bcr/CflA family efflux MFS transporter [Pseudoxanthobacter sp.]|uniref:Bcr/CflA family efflux MFS transporter n=1 Tax=Pseudoxanthobacter sp. TaxID=1925742 RepID=UPI002FE321DB
MTTTRPDTTAATAPVITERRLTLIGSALAALGPISLSLYSPALPALAAAFGASHAAVNLTMTAYFGGFAFAQLACGPVSDAYGRRRAALGFIALYLVASCAAAMAPSVGWLIGARLAQGLGAAVGLSVSRAMVRDVFTGQPAARIMGMIGVMLGIGPAVSPTLGGLILTVAHWHVIFYVMILYGAALLAVLLLATPETHRNPDPGHLHPARLVRNYATLLSSAGFMRAALVMALTVGGIYMLAVMLPFVLIDQLGMSPATFGLTMLNQTGFYILGGLVAQRLMRFIPAQRLVPIGLAFCVAAGLGFAIGLRVFGPSLWPVILPLQAWAFGIALILPATTAGALHDFPHIAGAAAALLGFLQMASGFLGGLSASLFADPAMALATVPCASALLALAIHILLRPRRRPDTRTGPA